MNSAAQSPAAPPEQQVEALATILDAHNLNRIEFKHNDTSIVLERQAAVTAGASGVFAVPGAQVELGAEFAPAAAVAGVPAFAPLATAADAAAAVAPADASAFRHFDGKHLSAAAAPAAAGVPAAPGAPPTPAADAAAPPTPQPAVKHCVTAPLVGIAYRSKEPGAPPFVNQGDTVQEGTVLCLIEAMKMFNEVKAPCAGTVATIHFKDADLVEHGAPLLSLT